VANISSDSKVTILPSSARASDVSKPRSADAQGQQGAAASATAPSGVSSFDPSSSFFPQALPEGEAPAISPQRRPGRARWIWPLAGLLVVAAASVYYFLRQAEHTARIDSAGAPALDAAPSAKAAPPGSGVASAGLQNAGQARVTHTLPGGSQSPESGAAVRVQSTTSVAAHTENAVAPLPKTNPAETPTAAPMQVYDPAPRVTHTRPIAPAAAITAEEPQRPAPAAVQRKTTECSAPAAALGLCQAPATDQAK